MILTPDGGILSSEVTNHLEDVTGRALVALGEAVRVDAWGICVKETPHGCIYLRRMIYNWRVYLVEDPESAGYGGIGWCYEGPDVRPALHGALAWDGSPDTEPSGWRRAIHDDRHNGEPKPGVRQV